MATTYALTGQPRPVTEAGYPNGALIYNSSTVGTVYAADVPGDQSAGFPISPLGSLTWGPGRPLWLSTDTDGTAAVVDADSSSALSLPSAIASQILSQGLAQQIAQQILTTGVRSIDQPAQLYEYSGNFVQAITELTTANIDVSAWRSLRVQMTVSYSGAGAGPSDVHTFGVQFGDGATNTTSYRMVQGHQYCTINGTIPVKATNLFLSLATTAGASALNAYTCTITVWGSLLDQPGEQWACYNDLWEGSSDTLGRITYQGVTSVTYTLAGGVAVSLYPSWSYREAGGGVYFSWLIESGYASNTAGARVFYKQSTPGSAFSAGGVNSSTSADVIMAYPNISLGTAQPLLYLNNLNASTVSLQLAATIATY